MKPMVRPIDRAGYYAYILLYANDILCIHHNSESDLTKVDKYFKLEPESIREPDMCVVAKVWQVDIDNGVCSWALSPSQYVQEICRNVEEYVKNLGGR